jgi:hypothetical protein
LRDTLDEADAGLALDPGAGHDLRQRGIVDEGLRRVARREVVVDDDAVGVVEIPVDAVLDLAVAAADLLVLVEDLLPGVVVGDAVVDDKDDHLGLLVGFICLARQILPDP